MRGVRARQIKLQGLLLLHTENNGDLMADDDMLCFHNESYNDHQCPNKTKTLMGQNVFLMSFYLFNYSFFFPSCFSNIKIKGKKIFLPAPFLKLMQVCIFCFFLWELNKTTLCSLLVSTCIFSFNMMQIKIQSKLHLSQDNLPGKQSKVYLFLENEKMKGV